MRDGREIFRTGIGIFAATVLILECQLEGLGEVESVERAIQAWRAPDAKRRRRHRGRRIDLEQRHEWRRGLALAAQRDRGFSVPLDDPFRRPEAMTIRAACGFDFHRIAARAHGPDHRLVGVRLDHGNHAGVASTHAHYIKRRPVALFRQARPFRLQQVTLKE